MAVPDRGGFTIRDMMVCFAVLGVGLALFAQCNSGVDSGSSWRRARQLQCQNNLHWIARALQGHLNARGVLPNAGTFGERREAYPTEDRPTFDATESILYRMLKDPTLFNTSVMDPEMPNEVGPLRSWVVDILPWFEQNTLYDQFDLSRVYFSTQPNVGAIWSATVSNAALAATDISELRCPDDDTVTLGYPSVRVGNLSYAVNGGFSRWPGHTVRDPKTKRLSGVFPPGLTGSAQGVAPGYGKPMDWGADVARQTGAMFLGTADGDTPWDVRMAAAGFLDGMSMTVLVSENLSAGYSAPKTNPYAGGAVVNWAAPLPNSVMFFGSDNVCGGAGHLLPGSGLCVADRGLAPETLRDGTTRTGPSWAEANKLGSFEHINAGLAVPIEGGFPFPSSNHRGGVNVAMMDGSVRFVKETIDGAVWAKLLTPAGSVLPCDLDPGSPGPGCFRQTPVNSGDID